MPLKYLALLLRADRLKKRNDMEGEKRQRTGLDRDILYAGVRKAIKEGRITTIDGLFTYIEKSVVASDMGIDMPEFNVKIDDPRNLTIADVLLMTRLFATSFNHMLHLIGSKIKVIRNKRTPQHIRQDEGGFILRMQQLEVDLPALEADVKERLKETYHPGKFA